MIDFGIMTRERSKVASPMQPMLRINESVDDINVPHSFFDPRFHKLEVFWLVFGA